MSGEIVTTEEDWDERADELLLRYVGIKSTTEIARELGLGPLEVRRRVTELLDSIDVLTIAQERQKLLIQLRGLVDKAQERLDGTVYLPDREFAQTLNAASQTIRVQLQEIREMEKQDSEALDELNKMRVKELLSLMDEVVVTSVGEISKRYDLDEADLMNVFSSRLVECAAERDLESY